MALFDFLKRKEEAKKAKEAKPIKKTEKKTPKVSVEKQAEKPAAPAPKGKTPKNFSFEAVSEPHISEKSTYGAEQNQYTFKVLQQANKNEIKKTVEGIYGVNVLSVNIVKIPAKKRRLGKTQGFKKGYKKAIVRIAQGQKIEIL